MSDQRHSPSDGHSGHPTDGPGGAKAAGPGGQRTSGSKLQPTPNAGARGPRGSQGARKVSPQSKGPKGSGR